MMAEGQGARGDQQSLQGSCPELGYSPLYPHSIGQSKSLGEVRHPCGEELYLASSGRWHSTGGKVRGREEQGSKQPWLCREPMSGDGDLLRCPLVLVWVTSEGSSSGLAGRMSECTVQERVPGGTPSVETQGWKGIAVTLKLAGGRQRGRYSITSTGPVSPLTPCLGIWAHAKCSSLSPLPCAPATLKTGGEPPVPGSALLLGLGLHWAFCLQGLPLLMLSLNSDVSSSREPLLRPTVETGSLLRAP
jgi:hypothetical protein